jgi:hypothetical protein
LLKVRFVLPSTDSPAALRDFAAVPSMELNNCDRTEKNTLLAQGLSLFQRDGEY